MSSHTVTDPAAKLSGWKQHKPALYRRAWNPQPTFAVPVELNSLEAALLRKNRINIALAAGKHIPLAEIAAADAALAAACEARAGL